MAGVIARRRVAPPLDFLVVYSVVINTGLSVGPSRAHDSKTKKRRKTEIVVDISQGNSYLQFRRSRTTNRVAQPWDGRTMSALGRYIFLVLRRSLVSLRLLPYLFVGDTGRSALEI